MNHKISETGARMLKYQEQLADEYKYKPIPRTFFKDVRAEFEETLPEWCNNSKPEAARSLPAGITES